ncbi:DUF3617 domain-containing protein [Phenylobacterium sp.]|uniref:DUF3617 domain-containing protein n=1 Tax=Phenylobacterium sp. TaxID=1871053 RepID=UPI002CD53AAF|nr:DUF3617 family protein [Phenylobacterium sp.]HVI33018.1 DUF3617 family protein [Phenylobacterium sp.]
MRLMTSALLVAAVALPAAAAQTPIAPGYWETTSQIISPLPTKKTEKRCIREEDVEKFIGGAPNRHYTCTYPTREISGGKIRLVGSCKTKNSAPVPISGEGVYTRDSLRLDARVRAKLGGLTVPVHARTIAKRIGDACPAPTADGK